MTTRFASNNMMLTMRKVVGPLLRLLPDSTVVPILSGPLKYSRWLMHSGVHTYWRGAYEPELSRALHRLVKPGGICYDCGANVGYFTLLLSKLAGPQGRVFAFEPLPANAVSLRKHVQMNHCSNVEVIEAAITDHSGMVHFEPHQSMSRIESGGSLTVRCISLDTLNLPPPDLMKIDVEGAEMDLVAGAKNLILSHRPVILMSLHIEIKAARDFADWLCSLGYSVTFAEQAYDLIAIPPALTVSLESNR